MTDTDANRWPAEADVNTPSDVVGPCVRIAEGPLQGLEGELVARRESGRYLVRLLQGVYVETELVDFLDTKA